jgi:hypothetical protein
MSQQYRAVPWPEGAPDASTVPEAGTIMHWGAGWEVEEEVREVKVLTGIPFLDMGDWAVMVLDLGANQLQDYPQSAWLEFLHPVPEPTFTEADIRAAYAKVREHPVYADNLIRDLKKNQRDG